MRSCKNKKRENSVTKLENKISAKKKNKRRYGTPRWMATTRCGSVGVYWVFFSIVLPGFLTGFARTFTVLFFFSPRPAVNVKVRRWLRRRRRVAVRFRPSIIGVRPLLTGLLPSFSVGFFFSSSNPPPKTKNKTTTNPPPEARNPLNERPSKGAINPRADSRKGRPCPK